MKPLRLLSIFLLSLLLTATLRAQNQPVLRNGDVFEIRLSGMPVEFQQEYVQLYTVNEEGTVEIPYLGSMRSAGSTATQFGRMLEKKLVAEKIFTNPTVFINVRPDSRFVTVGGAVRNPGIVPWSADLTLSAAIYRVGGPNDFPDLHHIKLIREGKVQTCDLKRIVANPGLNPKLLPGDEIEIPE